MVTSHLLLLLNSLILLNIVLLPSFLLQDNLDDMLSDKLLVLQQSALHLRDPLIFAGWQVAQTYLPQKGSNGIELKN